MLAGNIDSCPNLVLSEMIGTSEIQECPRNESNDQETATAAGNNIGAAVEQYC